MVNICDLGRENVALGVRPRAAFSSLRSQFFTIRTSQPANNISVYVFFLGDLLSVVNFLMCASRTNLVALSLAKLSTLPFNLIATLTQAILYYKRALFLLFTKLYI